MHVVLEIFGEREDKWVNLTSIYPVIAMSELEKAHERIQAICEKIREETLDPAKQAAEEIIVEAKKEAERIREHARHEAQKIFEETKRSIEEEKRIFTSSLEQASKQTIELLKQKIESSLFNPTLEKWLNNEMGGAKEHAKLIDALITSINKTGLQTDLSVVIPQCFTPDEIISALEKTIAKQLKEGSVEVGDIKSGIRVTIKNKHMMLDLSDSTLREIVSSFIRKDFRKIFFAA